MPPSGYSDQQTQHVSALLRSCARALVAEAAENAETLVQALEREIQSIKGYIAERRLTAAERGILLITQGFYAEVLAAAPADLPGFDAAVDAAVRQVERQVLGIKIPIMKPAV